MDALYVRKQRFLLIVPSFLIYAVSASDHLKKTKVLVVSGYSATVLDGFTRTAFSPMLTISSVLYVNFILPNANNKLCPIY